MSCKVKWGIIGSGGIARRRTIPEGFRHADNAELTSVLGANTKANAELAAQCGAKAAQSLDELLGSGIDAVYIATPPHLHLEQTLACARAGKHVLCEKPLGRTVAEAEAMLEGCQRAGVRLGTALMMRFQTQHQAALQWIRDGRLGQVTFGRAQLSCWYPPIPGAWRQVPGLAGGGSLIDMGSHCLDLLEMFLGPALAVTCFTNRTVHGYASEDSAVVTLKFACGALGVVDAFFCVPDEASQNRLELYGSLGSILARGTIGQEASGEMTAHLQEKPSGYDPQQGRSLAGAWSITPPPRNTYRAEIEEFGRAILEGRDPLNSAALGLRNQRLVAACYESARTGGAVSISPG